jgi:hypothetical protein
MTVVADMVDWGRLGIESLDRDEYSEIRLLDVLHRSLSRDCTEDFEQV